MLSTTAQNNLLLLLQRERYKTPSHIKKTFLGAIEKHCRTDPWFTFLLQQLKAPKTSLPTTVDASVAETPAVFTGLSVSMLEQVQAMGDKLQAKSFSTTLAGIQLNSFPSFFTRCFSQPEFPSCMPGTAPETLGSYVCNIQSHCSVCMLTLHFTALEAGESKRRKVNVSSVERPQDDFVTVMSMQGQQVFYYILKFGVRLAPLCTF